MSHIEEARKVLNTWRDGDVVYFEGNPPRSVGRLVTDAVAALDRAELLVTPEMRELCQAASAVIDVTFYNESKWSANNNKRFAAAVSAYRALKQPKPRWAPDRHTGGGYFVRLVGDPEWMCLAGKNLTEAQAKAVADALNALEDKP